MTIVMNVLGSQRSKKRLIVLHIGPQDISQSTLSTKMYKKSEAMKKTTTT